MDEDEKYYTLIAGILTGNASAGQEADVKKLLQCNSSFRNLFNELSALSKNLKSTTGVSFDTDAAFRLVKQRLGQ